ncbi:serine hydrolase domain-containing protein [Kibdelosporangium persicum]|nr:serine hydrolase domain-containing protein [Kibdelosporangium persicum]
MDRLVAAYADKGRFSGSVLVARGARVMFRKGYGMANYEHHVPNTAGVAFRIGSQTKAFTAIAILQLQERGLLRAGEPVGTYLVGYPDGDRITIEHLLMNTSGIPDYVTTEEFTSIMGLRRSPDEVADSFRHLPLMFEPGARMSYSNSGWVLLGLVIERITGMAYRDYVREQILVPLGMSSSGLADTGDVIDRHADGYMSSENGVSRTPYLDNSNQYAAGGLHSTVEDLYRWHRGLHGGKLLSPTSVEELLKPRAGYDGSTYGYGYTFNRMYGRPRIEAAGGTIGFVSTTVHYPDDDLVVIVLSNFENGAYSDVADGLAAIALGQPYELPADRVFVNVDPSVFGAYLGRYTTSYAGRPVAMDVTREGDRLMVTVAGLKKTELRPLSPTKYFARMKGEVELTFVVDGDAQAHAVAMRWAGVPLTAQRVTA